MATALTRDRASDLMSGEWAIAKLAYTFQEEGRSEAGSTSLIAPIKTVPIMHRATKERA
jgi:hypothetical protein